MKSLMRSGSAGKSRFDGRYFGLIVSLPINYLFLSREIMLLCKRSLHIYPDFETVKHATLLLIGGKDA